MPANAGNGPPRGWWPGRVNPVIGAVGAALIAAVFGFFASIATPLVLARINPTLTFQVQDTLGASCFNFESLAIGFKEHDLAAAPFLYTNWILLDRSYGRTTDTIQVSLHGRPGDYYVYMSGKGIMQSGATGYATSKAARILIPDENGARYLINSNVECASATGTFRYKPTLQDALQSLSS